MKKASFCAVVSLLLGCDAAPVTKAPQDLDTNANALSAPTPVPAAPAAAAICGQGCEHSACAQTACGHTATEPTTAVAPENAEKAAPAGERAFGRPLTPAGEVLDVGQVMANAEPYLGKVVKCTGVVSRVCERAGCWLELRPEARADAQGLRVPMAGHAFFIPQDAVGHVAVVEGQLMARELSPEQRAHLEGEGLKAIGPLSLAATSVVVR